MALIYLSIKVQLKVKYTCIYVHVYTIYYRSVDYQPGLLSDPIFSIFLIVTILFFLFYPVTNEIHSFKYVWLWL